MTSERRVRSLPLLGPLLMGVVLAACSTADFAQPVNAFAAATTEAGNALGELNTSVADAYEERLTASILDGKAFLRLAEGECLTTSKACRLVAIRDGRSEFYPPSPPLTEMTELMGEVERYAKSLQALLQADTADQIRSRVDATFGNIEKLAGTVSAAAGGKGRAVPLPELDTALGEAVNWIAGQYVERLKLEGLRQATQAANPVIHDAAELFATAGVVASDAPRAHFAEEVAAAVDRFRTAPDSGTLTAATSAAARYGTFLSSAPGQLFERLAAAHDALTASLVSDGVSVGTAMARIQGLADEATSLATILAGLRAATTQEGRD